MNDNKSFKAYLSLQFDNYPELFPEQMTQDNWSLNGYVPESKKQGCRIRRIIVKGNGVWQVHPSFLMPYMSCTAEEAAKYLFLMNWCPPWALAEVFGKYPMYYYRLQCHFGSYSMVGTTVKNKSRLPSHLLADEKYARISGEKVYLGVTCGEDCFLGASISLTASEEDLTIAYGNFKEEARLLSEDYAPKTVNTERLVCDLEEPFLSNSCYPMFSACCFEDKKRCNQGYKIFV